MATKKLRPLLSHQVFRVASGASALVALTQGVLGSLLGGRYELRGLHAGLAVAFLIVSVLAALSGMRYGKESRTTGLFGLGLAIVIAGVVQYGLGEMSITWLHQGLGLLIVLAAGVLFVRSLAQPVIVTAGDADVDAG